MFWLGCGSRENQCQESWCHEFLALVPEVDTINPRRIDLGNFWVWLQKAKFNTSISAATICLRRRQASDHKVENAPQCSRTCNRKTKDSLTKHMGAVEQGRLKQRANEQRQLVRTGRKETKRETHRHEHSRNLGPSVQGEDQESTRTETAFPNRQRENKSKTHGDEHWGAVSTLWCLVPQA